MVADQKRAVARNTPARSKRKAAPVAPKLAREKTWWPEAAVAVPRTLSSFGALPERTCENMYMTGLAGNGNGRGGGTGSVTNNTEVGITVTDFFDYQPYLASAGGVAQYVANYFWETDQNLFDNGGQTDRTFCRVRSLEVFVLPLKGFSIVTAEPNQTNATGMITVNCQTPGVGVGSGTSVKATATDTQVTNITPQFDTVWKKVFSCNLQKTFASAVIRPFFEGTAQCLFSLSIVDPTTGESYLSGSEDQGNQPIRCKVVLKVDQPVTPYQQARIRVFQNEDFALPSTPQNGAAYTAPTLEYLQMRINGAKNTMR
jgi:hypothetical protein